MIHIESDIQSQVEVIPGRRYTCLVAGTFGGTELTVQHSHSLMGAPVPVRANLTSSAVFDFIAAGDLIVYSLQESTAPDLFVLFTLCPLGV